MAWSDSPYGPWTKSEAPILSPSKDGEWLGHEDNRFLVTSKGSFDSHKVHDPCLMYFNDKFYLYYKGETMGEGMNKGGREIKHGVAIADHILGPYIKSDYNPITNSGHEVAVWHQGGGIASSLPPMVRRKTPSNGQKMESISRSCLTLKARQRH
ncbi:hypothetical protein JCM19239_4833 [Vibrio variabilis]|uniref:Uncharacterized protein n=1 Tax=Vibrio variabilis TaxID=990271 RepID=A0ABQ0JGH3_9VIBR|nr:hypothetical protein JCM19239_4833 [Vibrio variabilis]